MSAAWFGACALLLSPLLPSLPAAEHTLSGIIDDLRVHDVWTAAGTGEVGAELRWIAGPHSDALCLDYDFNRASGFATARRVLPMRFPADYEFRFSLRGEGGPNYFQFKLVDASGENVWWISRTEFSPPPDWQPQRYKKRHVEFAWGPTADRVLRESTSIELTVAAGSGGGRGNVCVDALRFVERVPAGTPPSPVLTSLAPAHADDLAKALDDLHRFGLDRLMSGLALEAIRQHGLDTRFLHFDTTTLSFYSAYEREGLDAVSDGINPPAAARRPR